MSMAVGKGILAQRDIGTALPSTNSCLPFADYAYALCRAIALSIKI
jgi:hypothetical protein